MSLEIILKGWSVKNMGPFSLEYQKFKACVLPCIASLMHGPLNYMVELEKKKEKFVANDIVS